MCIFPVLYTYSVLNQQLAAEHNNQLNFAGLRVYGLLTDLTQFEFYSYNPTAKQFCFDEEIIIDNRRITAFHDMIDGLGICLQWLLGADHFLLVSNKIFGIILTAYIDGLRAIISRSKDRAKKNDVKFRIILSMKLLMY